MNENALTALRTEFAQEAGRSLSLPIAGVIVWTIAGIAALVLPQQTATYVLLFGSGAIFPIGLAVARMLGENPIANSNPLSRLMGLCVLMVNLLWALHLTLLFQDASYFPLSLGIGLGLHWVVFSWIIGHPVGTIHAILRTILSWRPGFGGCCLLIPSALWLWAWWLLTAIPFLP